VPPVDSLLWAAFPQLRVSRHQPRGFLSNHPQPAQPIFPVPELRLRPVSRQAKSQHLASSLQVQPARRTQGELPFLLRQRVESFRSSLESMLSMVQQQASRRVDELEPRVRASLASMRSRLAEQVAQLAEETDRVARGPGRPAEPAVVDPAKLVEPMRELAQRLGRKPGEPAAAPAPVEPADTKVEGAARAADAPAGAAETRSKKARKKARGRRAA